MSYKEREMVEPEKVFVCDICGGEIAEEPFTPDKWKDDQTCLICFHKVCWDNAQAWVHDCPDTLFKDGEYGTHVEAVRNHKHLLFIDSEEEDQAMCVVCGSKKEMDETADELDFDSAAEDVIGVVVDGRYRNASARMTVCFDED